MLKQIIDEFSCVTLEELFVNHSSHLIKIDRNGFQSKSRLDHLGNSESLINELQQFARNQGLRLDPRKPASGGVFLHEQLHLRWHAVIPPASPQGALLSLRRLDLGKIPLEQFSEDQSSLQILQDIDSADIVIFAGETGSGKTSLLTSLAMKLLYEQRVFVLETLAEIAALSPYWVSLLSAYPDLEDKGRFDCEQLVAESLRLRPDRFILGEIRDEEAPTLFNLATSASAGVWTTIHTSSPDQLLPRLQNLSRTSFDDWHRVLASLEVVYLQLNRKSPRLRGLYRYGIDGFQEI